MKSPLRTRRRLLGAVAGLAVLLVLSGCSALVLPEGWAGIAADGKLVEGRYEEARYVYVAYRDVIFRVDTETAPPGKPTERLIDWAARAANNAPMFAPPALGEDSTVYQGTYGHSLHAFSPEANPRGQPLTTWNPPAPRDKIVAGALVHDELVYVGQGDKGINAYDARTGALRASYSDTEFGVWAAPVIDEATNTLYFGALDHYLYALAADTLALQWKVDVGGAVAATPLLHEGLLYVGTFANELVAVDARRGEIVNRYETEGWVWSTPVVKDGVLYFGDLAGFVYALEIESGQYRWKIHNKDTLRGIEENPGGIRGKVAVVSFERDGEMADMVIVASEGKYLQALDQRTGQVIWTSSPPSEERILSDLIVIGENVIFTTLSENQLVVAHNLERGFRSWSVRKPGQEDFDRLALTQPAPR